MGREDITNQSILNKLEKNNQILFKYCDEMVILMVNQIQMDLTKYGYLTKIETYLDDANPVYCQTHNLITSMPKTI